MKLTEVTLQNMIHSFRDFISDPREATRTALQLVAWLRLSRREKIPEDLAFPPGADTISPERLTSGLARLVEAESLGKNRAAFLFPPQLARASNGVGEINIRDASSLERFFPSHLFSSPTAQASIYQPEVGDLSVPYEIAGFMASLLGDITQRKVYCAFDAGASLAIAAAERGACPFLETRVLSEWPALANLLLDLDITFSFSDPILRPSFLENPTTLAKADYTLAFPPLAARYTQPQLDSDPFRRFKDKLRTGTVHAIRHVLAQTKERAIVLVPDNILFAPGAEAALREDLLEGGILNSVISLPRACVPLTPVGLSLLILDPAGGNQTVRFVNGSAERFCQSITRGRSQLTNREELLTVWQKSNDESLAREILTSDICSNDFNLEVHRYLITPAMRAVESALKQSPVKQLLEVADFIRPPKHTSAEDPLAVPVCEVRVSDLPEYGPVREPSTQLLLDAGSFEKLHADDFLQPGDIILTIKGNVGKVGFIPEAIPAPGRGGWLPHQSCIVLRAKDSVLPEALYMYLRSELGQKLLSQIRSGATVPLIQLKALKSLAVVVPSLQEQQQIAEVFWETARLEEEMRSLRQKQATLMHGVWGLDEVEVPGVD